jgi:hypothetical protein
LFVVRPEKIGKGKTPKRNKGKKSEEIGDDTADKHQ